MLRSKLIKWCMNTSLITIISFAPFANVQAEKISPLDRLRERSANKRWEEVRGTWMPVQSHGLEIQRPKRLEHSGDFVAPSRPVVDLEAGTKPVPAPAPDRATGVKPESSRPEIPQSLARPFPPVEAASPFPKPAMVHSVPDPYLPKAPIASESLTQPQSIQKPTVVPAQQIPAQIQLTDESGSATLEDSLVEEKSLVETAPALQTPEPLLLIAPPTMTAQAELESQNTPYVPPAVDINALEEMPRVNDAQSQSIAEGHDTIFRPISQIEPYFDYSPSGDNSTRYLCPQPGDIPETERERCPDMKDLPQNGSIERHFAGTDFHWQASNLTHNPLYFEDVSLERYGHTYPDIVQPFVSVGKFGVQLIGLPYQMALEAPCNCRYALGYYRPGECAPHLKYRIPFNGKAAVSAGAFYTGAILLFP